MRLALFFVVVALLAAASTTLALPALPRKLPSCASFDQNVPGRMHILRRIVCDPSTPPSNKNNSTIKFAQAQARNEPLMRRLGFGDWPEAQAKHDQEVKQQQDADKQKQQQQQQAQTDALNKIADEEKNGGDVTCKNTYNGSHGKRNACNFDNGDQNNSKRNVNVSPERRLASLEQAKAQDDKNAQAAQQKQQQQQDQLNQLKAQTDALNRYADEEKNLGDVTCNNQYNGNHGKRNGCKFDNGDKNNAKSKRTIMRRLGGPNFQELQREADVKKQKEQQQQQQQQALADAQKAQTDALNKVADEAKKGGDITCNNKYNGDHNKRNNCNFDNGDQNNSKRSSIDIALGRRLFGGDWPHAERVHDQQVQQQQDAEKQKQQQQQQAQTDALNKIAEEEKNGGDVTCKNTYNGSHGKRNDCNFGNGDQNH